jgi:serine/threonine protein kinase
VVQPILLTQAEQFTRFPQSPRFHNFVLDNRNSFIKVLLNGVDFSVTILLFVFHRAEGTVMHEPENQLTQSLQGASETKSFAGPDVQATPSGGQSNTLFAPEIPGYTILRKVGDGGMGAIFAAKEERFNREVALKVLRASADTPALRKRFLAEARILGNLDHINVIRVYDAGQSGYNLYYTMKLLEKCSLREQLLALRVNAKAADIIQLMLQIVRAIQYLHENGVWHRDIKPANVMMDRGVPRVTDFGVAKWTQSSLETRTGQAIGTTAYMAPEMIREGSRVSGPQADVWSLGIMLYELLAGVRPFRMDDASPSLEDVILKKAPTELPLNCLPGVDERLQAIVLRALAKEPEDRYSSAKQLADDLEQWLAQGEFDLTLLAELRRKAEEPFLLTPPPKPRKSVPRHVWLAMVAAVFFMLFLGGGVYGAITAHAKNSQPTLKKLFEKNGEVVLVNEKGELKQPLSLMPGCQGTWRTDGEEQCLELTGNPLGMFDFGEAPAKSFRIEAEVEHAYGSDITSRFMIYFKSQAHPRPLGSPEHSMFGLSFNLSPRELESSRIGKVYLGANLVNPNAPGLQDLSRMCAGAEMELARFPPGRRNIMKKVVIEVHEAGVQAWVDNMPMFPRQLSWKLPSGKLLSLRATEGQPALNPMFGSGFGFIVTAGTATVRNVCIRRLPE